MLLYGVSLMPSLAYDQNKKEGLWLSLPVLLQHLLPPPCWSQGQLWKPNCTQGLSQILPPNSSAQLQCIYISLTSQFPKLITHSKYSNLNDPTVQLLFGASPAPSFTSIYIGSLQLQPQSRPCSSLSVLHPSVCGWTFHAFVRSMCCR